MLDNEERSSITCCSVIKSQGEEISGMLTCSNASWKTRSASVGCEIIKFTPVPELFNCRKIEKCLRGKKRVPRNIVEYMLIFTLSLYFHHLPCFSICYIYSNPALTETPQHSQLTDNKFLVILSTFPGRKSSMAVIHIFSSFIFSVNPFKSSLP